MEITKSKIMKEKESLFIKLLGKAPEKTIHYQAFWEVALTKQEMLDIMSKSGFKKRRGRKRRDGVIKWDYPYTEDEHNKTLEVSFYPNDKEDGSYAGMNLMDYHIINFVVRKKE